MSKIKTGKIVKCYQCSKEVYKQNCFLIKSKNLFCSLECANNYQRRNKLRFICKICNKEFYWSKSRIKNHNPTYCSIECRNKDNEWIRNACIKGNLVQQSKRGLNKLELKGRKILEKINIKFKEQSLLFGKFLVDVELKDYPIVIQWDGKYWHSKPKRKRLDNSQDSYLEKCGFSILRFSDKEVYEMEENIIDNIQRAIYEIT